MFRVFYEGTDVRAIEYRVDETYSDANRPREFSALLWVVVEKSDLQDAQGDAVLMDELQVVGLQVSPKPTWVARKVLEQNRSRGAGGRLDVLLQRLSDDIITEAEIREYLRLKENL